LTADGRPLNFNLAISDRPSAIVFDLAVCGQPSVVVYLSALWSVIGGLLPDL
jgi:hypothetical protein